MDWLTAVAKTFGARVLGAAASGVAGWVFAKTRGVVTVDPATLTTVAMQGALMIGTYAATHRAASSVVNPVDAAKGRVADAGKVAADNGGTVVVPVSK